MNDSSVLSLLTRPDDGHKGVFGTVLVIGGSRGMTGAASLCGSAALRAGCGLVRLAVPDVCLETAAGLDRCYTTIPLSCDTSGKIALSALPCLLEEASKAAAVALGPGLSRSPELTQLVLELYRQIEKPMVVDADALNALAEAGLFSGIGSGTGSGTGLGIGSGVGSGTGSEGNVESETNGQSSPKSPGVFRAPGGRILTPHPGEFLRLRPIRVSDPSGDSEKRQAINPMLKLPLNQALNPTLKLSRERQIAEADVLARQAGVVVVLKGHRTYVTNGELSYLNSTGNSGMATGGSGDVLTGITASFLAQQYPLWKAACCAVWMHGLAGDCAAQKLGAWSVTAESIIGSLPEAFLRVPAAF